MSSSAGGRLFILLLLYFLCSSVAYDPMDPDGNITIKWDFMTSNDNHYTVLVSIYNYQLYRHIEIPGWRLGWTWPNDEVIWDMRGAESTNQGDCSRFKGDALPHCCDKSPTIIDLPIGAPYNLRTADCCRSGVLSSLAQGPSLIRASFQMVIDSRNITDDANPKPYNFTLGVPGYSCSNATTVAPSKFKSDTQRTTQAQSTWEVICSYSQFRESATPSCCVSLSTFYDNTIVSCPDCSCGCQGTPTSPLCLRDDEQSRLKELSSDGDGSQGPLLCTKHMCPISVHWHVKVSYKEYWRVKMTITNYNMNKNYSDWNLVLQHPNLRSLVQIFSFNYHPLLQYGSINDTGVFWGIEYYNDMLLNYGENGNVQSEMLLHKDTEEFTFKGGWPFPRRLSFNGHDCVMPPPDLYPSLPKDYSMASSPLVYDVTVFLSSILLSVVLVLL
ncbi:COBRA-like protein 7 [Curcuma longa]|uniref:COBRA-like protein 7 n=1 Tax=Curcuma longa TaxID=136217 RepID=UPI003D9F2E4B